jgi:hypothetical protein
MIPSAKFGADGVIWKQPSIVEKDNSEMGSCFMVLEE